MLDDVTVSQVSIVAALRRANPGLSRRFLYREATKVGRDHVASTVNTLVLAYAGASLPLLLFFVQGDQPAGRLLTSELIAVEIVRMLVGSIGLVASVPITTALAAAVLGSGDDVHGHAHGTRRRRRRRRMGFGHRRARHRGRRTPRRGRARTPRGADRSPGAPPAGTRRVGEPVAVGRLLAGRRAVVTSRPRPGAPGAAVTPAG